jgi:hypothetical protein
MIAVGGFLLPKFKVNAMSISISSNRSAKADTILIDTFNSDLLLSCGQRAFFATATCAVTNLQVAFGVGLDRDEALSALLTSMAKILH